MGLWQTDVGEYAFSEFLGHHLQACRLVIEGRDQREDRRSGIGCKGHVADVDLVERRLSQAKNQRPALFQSYVGGAFDQMLRDSIGNARQRAGAARDDDHRLGRIRPAGHVGTDVGVLLLLDLRRLRADELSNEVGTARQAEFFRKHTKCAVGSNKVYGLDAVFAFDGEQEVLQKYGAAGAGRRDGQIFRG